MERNSFIIALIAVLVILYVIKIHEPYVSCSYDITPSITTNMDWKGATLSKYPYYTNNLINPPTDVLNNIKKLQMYQQKEDGSTNTNYVTIGSEMNMQQKLDNLDNPNTRIGDKFKKTENFSMMNPYVPN